MPRKHLTDVVCQTLKAGKQTRYWNTTLSNFGMSVGPRSKTFVVMHGVDRRLTTLGKYPALSLADARRAAHRVLGSHTPSNAVTYQEAKSDYVEQHCRKSNRPGTIDQTIRNLNAVSFGRLDQISRRDVQTAIVKFTPSRANHIFASLKALLNWCVDRGMLVHNPLLRAKLPHKTTSRSRVLSDAELMALWSATGDFGTFGQIIRLAILTGLRKGEIAQIKPEWFQGDLLVIPSHVTKNAREHTLPLSTYSIECSQKLALSLNAPYNYWNKPKEKLDLLADVHAWTIHDLRRTFATIHARMGTAPHVIEALLNHASGQISGVAAVYNRYQYLDEKRTAMLAYEDYVTALMSPKQLAPSQSQELDVA